MEKTKLGIPCHRMVFSHMSLAFVLQQASSWIENKPESFKIDTVHISFEEDYDGFGQSAWVVDVIGTL
jgi:hypothetical protein